MVVRTMRFCILMTLCYVWKFSLKNAKKDEHAIFGLMLIRHIFKKLKSSIAVECNQVCNDDFQFHSFNCLIWEKLSELKNWTKEARPENFCQILKDFISGVVRKEVSFIAQKDLTLSLKLSRLLWVLVGEI